MSLEQAKFTPFLAFSLLLHIGVFIIPLNNSKVLVTRKYVYLELYKKGSNAFPMTKSAIKTFDSKLEDKKDTNISKTRSVSEASLKKKMPAISPADNLGQKGNEKIGVDYLEENVFSLEEVEDTEKKEGSFLPLEDGEEDSEKNSLEAEVEPSDPKSSWNATGFDLEAYAVYVKEFLQKSIEYPYLARKRNIEGELLLEVVVEANGRLSDFRILKTSGYKILDENTLDSIKGLVLDKKPDFRAVLQFDLIYRLD